MAQLVLHVGMHKAGSSTIQGTLRKAQTDGRLPKLRYLDSVQPNHSFVISRIFGSDANEAYYRRVKFGLGIPKNHPRTKDARAALEREIEAAGAADETLVISGEDICALHCDEVQDMKDFFVARGIEKFLVVVYMRSAEEWATSYSQQFIKQGAGTIENKLLDPPYPMYKEYTGKFLEVFGRENVKVRQFSREHFPDGCVVKDFLSTFGADDLQKDMEIVIRNVSLTLAQTQLASLINEFDHSTNAKAKQFVRRCFSQYQPEKGSQKFRLTREALDIVQERARADIEWAGSELGIDPGFLTRKADSLSREELLSPVEIRDLVGFIDIAASNAVK